MDEVIVPAHLQDEMNQNNLKKKEFDHRILTNRSVSLLQYSAVDSNPLSVYVMHPFWNFVVKVRKNLCNWMCVSLSVCVSICVCVCVRVYIINEVSKRLLW